MLGAIFDKWWSQSESNQRHKDFQSFALPTELCDPMVAGEGYEPDELPDCSIPRYELIKMAQKLGFEPRRRSHDLPVFKTGPFSHLGTSAYV